MTRRPETNVGAPGAGPASDGEVDFPIVGIGASAGGLDAFGQLLKELPIDSGMAFVLVQHLDPTHPSLLSEALARTTRMPVVEVTEGVRVAPDTVYTIPPDTCMALVDGHLTLSKRPDDGRVNLPIDHFFRSLAEVRGSHAIGVVLSGNASDGTEGLAAIQAELGITFAQDPRSAKCAGMPRSAVDAGVVDHCLSLVEIARELARLSRHAYVVDRASASSAFDAGAMQAITNRVLRVVGLDFGEWKTPTVERRLVRRMAIAHAATPAEYLALLERSPDEVRALAEGTLIHVTSFFRDPPVFAALRQDCFPRILADKPEGVGVRVWVAGCSSGEEVYSFAIALLEFLEGHPRTHPLQLFGSDVSDRSIARARAGVYPDAALANMEGERRRRYFTKVDGGWRINKAVRDLCVFNRHDVSRDPPFSKLDLVSCRNVLIYFDQPLQRRVVPLLHYCLNDPGFLVLGRTESISGFDALFAVENKACRIFARRPGRSPAQQLGKAPRSEVRAPQLSSTGAARADDAAKRLDRLLIDRYAPAGVLIDQRLDVLEFRGETGPFLQPASGPPQSNLVKMARASLIAVLRPALAEAAETMAVVRRERVQIGRDATTDACDLVVIPLDRAASGREPLFAVLFDAASDGAPRAARARRTSSPTDDARIAQLEHELAATRIELEVLIEEHGRASDDLGSTNEELVSGNEELQSMNEELETAKEELESANEELTTVNDELQSSNQEMNEVNTDLVNLLVTVDLPILILDMDRRIRRFTPRARSIANVVAADLGRPLSDLTIHLAVPDLDRQVAEVIDTITPRELEVQDAEGRWFRLQIRPYKTAEQRIGGAILSLVDIDALKNLVGDAQHSRAQSELANIAKDQFLATLSHELRTPLTTMLMHAQILARGEHDAARVKRAGEAIERATMMQVQLIEDLVDVSRIVAGKLGMKREPVDLAAVVEAATEWITAPAQRKLVSLIVRSEPLNGTVLGDAGRLQQIASNLLTNAVKFTPSKGVVSVHLSAENGRAKLEVSDTGAGIDRAFLPHVFERFSQQDGSNTRPASGLGLGLSIVKHLVDLHGGSVRASSPGLGKGATFVVELPLVEATAATVATTLAARETLARAGGRPDPAALPLRGVRILLVDDEAPAREAMSEMLTLAQATVRVAASAVEAMSTLAAFRPDVLLCDIGMPDQDGYTMLRRVRASTIADGRDVLAIALTAFASERDVKAAHDAGFQMHVAKPVGIDRLTAAIVELLAMPRTSAIPS